MIKKFKLIIEIPLKVSDDETELIKDKSKRTKWYISPARKGDTKPPSNHQEVK